MRVLVDTRNAIRSLNRRVSRLRRHPERAEFWNARTRPFDRNGLGHSIAATDRLVSRISTFFTVLPDPIETFYHSRRYWSPMRSKGVKVHDARLVASMEAIA